MPPRCAICVHKDRAGVERALMDGSLPLRTIAVQFGTNKTTLLRHRDNHLPPAITSQQQAAAEVRALDVVGEIRRLLCRINLLFDACDRWLRDPENPDQYSIDPRGEDINVIVWEDGGGRGQRVMKKRKMSYLLDKLEQGGIAVERWETKHADPRELVLKTADSLKGQMEFLAKLEGQLNEGGTVNVFISPEWLALRAALLVALTPFPDARTAVAEQLLRLNAA